MESDATSPQPQLTLYMDRSCAFCQSVLLAIDGLELDVGLRDIRASAEARAELHGATGRMTVPVMKIERTGAPARWMPESLDIIRELETLAGVKPAPAWLDRVTQLSRPLGFGLAASSILVASPASDVLLWSGIVVFGLGLIRRRFLV